MRIILLACFFIVAFLSASAGRISGVVKDDRGGLLGFASISVKGSSKGVVANSQGMYSINLDPGNYTLVCQFVGYKAQEKKVSVTNEDLTLNFSLSIQELTMEAVVIKRGPDPALEIMRQTIKKRNFYNGQVDSLTVDVYIKGLLRSRAIPNKIMGQKIDRSDMAKDGIDSAGKGILFLSESVTKVEYAKPDKLKYKVVSSKTSGGGYGFSLPFFINFYENNVSVSNTNPRGFISPIADGAFHYYTFRYEGNFFEGDKMIDRIRVRPKRKNEPLFDGFIQIVDGEWRIHSLELTTTSDYQLELMDTLRITQIHNAVTPDIWRTQSQVVYVTVKKFGFDVAGNFLNVYSNYNLQPGFEKKHFGRVFMIYDSSAIKRDSSYWAAIRPVPLEPDEKRDYIFKDSVNRAERDSFSRQSVDSLRKIRNPLNAKEIFIGSGLTRNHFSTRSFGTYRIQPLLKKLEYNTVEGLALRLVQSYDINPKKGRNNYRLEWDSRYGFSNEHLNSFLSFTVDLKKQSLLKRYINFAGGRRVSQFNHDEPIDALTNSMYTLFGKRNYMKLYENWFGSIRYFKRFENGWKIQADASFEDRLPLQNTTTYSFFEKERTLLPNHPYELDSVPFLRHQAMVAGFLVQWQPGQRYIQFPRSKIAMGSKYPTLELQYAKGFRNILGSDIDFDKWKVSVFDAMNFKMGGEFRYRLSIGGFLNARRVEIPDYQHFNGNQTFYNSRYLNSFQLAPYYRYSNKETLYLLVHGEHHFNGLLTNKIPLFNRLKWNLVTGSNMFYVNRENYYLEAFAGLENILKIFRVDFVTAIQAQPGHSFGIRIGLGGILGGNLSVYNR